MTISDNILLPFNQIYEEYLSDESRLSGMADYICFPCSEREILHVLRHASKNAIPVTISGGKTGITGGCVPANGIVMSFSRMNRFLGLGFDEKSGEWRLRLEPGVLLKDIHEALYHKDFPDMKESDSLEQKSLMTFHNSDIQLFYPPDPTEQTAQIGGTVACNASGARTFGFGSTREYVRKIRVALASGEIIEIPRGKYFADERGVIRFDAGTREILIPIPSYPRPLAKNTAGYYSKPGMDLIDLFIGSEGTLGIMTEIELRLIPTPPFILGAVIFLPSPEDAVLFVRLIRGELDLESPENVKPHALEYIGPFALDLLRERRKTEGASSSLPPLPDSAGAVVYYERLYDNEKETDEICLALENILSRVHSSLDSTWAEFDSEGIAKIRAFRHAVPETVNSLIGRIKSENPGITKLGTDFAVPDRFLGAMLDCYREKLREANLRYIIFGHIGNNHLHVNIIPKNESEYEMGKRLYEELAKKAIEFGGTVAAEHGIGKLKKNLLKLMIREKGIEEMRRIKRILDPQNLLNRGNLF
ncbi:FAD-binding oxidoreductase [Candidatus Sumerlaeota bacterium]|nr:FAD-binding oxidoreductase [Candidatus Sumerlaeota bacterium]